LLGSNDLRAPSGLVQTIHDLNNNVWKKAGPELLKPALMKRFFGPPCALQSTEALLNQILRVREVFQKTDLFTNTEAFNSLT